MDFLERISGLAGEASGDQKTALQTALVDLRVTCLVVMRGIAREVQEMPTAYQRHRQICMTIITRSLTSKGDLDRNRFLSQKINYQSPRGKKIPVRVALRKWACRPGKAGRFGQQSRQPWWVNWWRWLGHLGIASRNYPKAERALLTALSAVRHVRKGKTASLLQPPKQGDTRQPLVDVLKDIVTNLHADNPTALGKPCKEANRLRIEVVRVLEQYVQLMLLAEQLELRREKPASFIALAQQCIDDSLSILDMVDVDAGAGAWRPSDVFSLRAHLLMHQSVLMSKQSKQAETLRCLSLAEAQLGFSDPGREGILWAMLDLHRAEAALSSAEHATDADGGSERFSEYCEKLRETRNFGVLPKKNGTIRVGEHGAIVGDRWRTVLAALKDAAAALKRAEAMLMSRRRNVWWVTWFFHRRLKVVELELWATLGDAGQPIPHLGFESACRLTSTIADDLLENALRMVRLDAYRLATIVETYANCVLALHVRLGIDPDAEPLPRRQKEMGVRLNGALVRLRFVKEERQKRQKRKIENSQNNHDLSSVFDYIGDVEGRAQKILQLTEKVHHRAGGLLRVTS